MSVDNPELEELKRAVENAITTYAINAMVEMTVPESADYRRRLRLYGGFDFIIGDFGVKRISGRKHEQ